MRLENVDSHQIDKIVNKQSRKSPESSALPMFRRETSPREEKIRKREQRDHLVGVLIQSLVRQQYFDFEQEISGIAYQESAVGDPFASDGSCFEFGKSCNQTLVHGRIVYLYKLHESDMAVASDVKSFLTAQFREWEND